MNSAGLSISSAVGRKSGWFQTASRLFYPYCVFDSAPQFGCFGDLRCAELNADYLGECLFCGSAGCGASRLRSWRRWMGCVRSGLG